MELRHKDPYCNFLFHDELDKSSLIAQHELDIASFYGKHSGIKTEKYYTGEALLKILKEIFTHKKFKKFIKREKENELFYTSNCKLLETEIASNNFNAEQVFTIITNFLTMTNFDLNQSKSANRADYDDSHLHSPEIVHKIRNLFGLKLRSLEKMKSHYLRSKIFNSLILVILILFVFIIGACIADWYHFFDFSQKLTFFAPLVTRSETKILQITALFGAIDLYQSSIMIIIGIFLLASLLLKSIFTIVRIHKTEKLDYKIHYLSRIIGESSQKLREIGWL